MDDDRPGREHKAGEELPASRGGRRRATAIGCFLLILILVFLVWFTAENSEPPEQGGSIIGSFSPSGDWTSADPSLRLPNPASLAVAGST